MGNITKNLSRPEIRCPCCGVDTFDFETALGIQKCVDYFQSQNPGMDIRLHVNSGNRCVKHNATVKGASPTSKHTEYRAMDFYLYDKITGIRMKDQDVYDYLDQEYPDKFGIGIYVGRVHLDSRAAKRRWDKR